MWGCHTSRKPGIRAWACQNGSSDEYLSMGLFFQVCFRVPRPSFSPAPDAIASPTPASDPLCSLDVLAASVLLDPYPWPMASVCDCHPSGLQNNGPDFALSPSHSALVSYSYIPKPDPPGSQMSGTMQCDPAWNELRRKILVSVTCKTIAPVLTVYL